MEVVLSHVYTASNSGDGLLARLSAELIQEALGERPVIVAIDPAGMAEIGEPITYGQSPRSLRGAATEMAAAFHLGRTKAMSHLSNADLVVGIGGGYLRAVGWRQSAVLAAAHLPQLVAETSGRCPRSVFLPQSIGPLPPQIRKFVARRLERASAVLVRDEVSAAELGHLGNVARVPDLAALEVGRLLRSGLHARSVGGDNTVLVQVRDLPRIPGWLETVRSFVARLSSPIEVAIQSTDGASNNDRPFTEMATGSATGLRLEDVVASPDRSFGVAICGRLHAALACLMAGIPAIHIAYERKSVGVFSDLGLEDYVVQPHDLANGRAATVVDDVLKRPAAYWTALAGQADHLHRSREQVVDALQQAAESIAEAGS